MLEIETRCDCVFAGDDCDGADVWRRSERQPDRNETNVSVTTHPSLTAPPSPALSQQPRRAPSPLPLPAAAGLLPPDLRRDEVPL